MDEKTIKGLKSLPLFAVGLAVFRTEGRSLQVLLCQPDWLNSLREWILPEATLVEDETIVESASRFAATVVDGHHSPAVQMQTYARGKGVLGALTVCYVSVPPSVFHRGRKGFSYVWCDVEHLSYSRVFHDLDRALKEAIEDLSDNLPAIALLISRPFFTVVELQRAVNEVRRIAGRQGQMDIRNLRRMLDGAEWLIETTEVRSDGAFRPSKLYKVKEGS